MSCILFPINSVAGARGNKGTVQKTRERAVGGGEGGKAECRSGQKETSRCVENFGICLLVRIISYSSVSSFPLEVIAGRTVLFSFIVSDTVTKRHSDDEKYYPEGKRYPKLENPPPSSESSCGSVAYCTSASISSSSTHFPDSDYDVWMEAEGEVYVNVDREDDMPQQPDFNSEAKVITEQDSLEAIYQYYSTVEGKRLRTDT